MLDETKFPEKKPAKKRFVAKTGIDFEGLKPPVRVEAGQEIPAGVKDSEIKELLASGVIEVKE